MGTRLEYKYYINREIYPRMLNDVKAFCDLDTNSNEAGYYEVNSIYFDSMNLNCYFDRLDGNYKKVKFRLRSYENNKSARFFIEMKHKINEKSFKNKMEIDEAAARSMLNRKSDEKKNDDTAQLNYFKNILRINNLCPFININYKRTALFCRQDKDVRITFDYDVRCCRFQGANKLPQIPVVQPRRMILEIKPGLRLPWWVPVLIKKYNLKKQSISKYLLSVQLVAANSAFCLK